MSRVCQICERGTQSGATRSHSNIESKRKVKINLQVKHVDGKKKRICTRCIKTLAKKSSK